MNATGSPLLRTVVLALGASLLLSACEHHEAHEGKHHHTVVSTTVARQDVALTREYVAQIHARRHIEVRALERGYLQEVLTQEGARVAEGEVLFRLNPITFQAHRQRAAAEARLARLEYENAARLGNSNVISPAEVALAEARAERAQAELALAEAELNFTTLRAPFPGIVDRFHAQEGSLVEEGHPITTLSDNRTMWVYFNVPEVEYLTYMARGLAVGQERAELLTADGRTYPVAGTVSAIEADFNNHTGTIPFRADFPNPTGVLRHGQTGTVRLTQTAENALVIPQKAVFEILDQRFVFVVDEASVVHQRAIQIGAEVEDLFVVQDGLRDGEAVIIDGLRHVKDGEAAEVRAVSSLEALADLKWAAE